MDTDDIIDCEIHDSSCAMESCNREVIQRVNLLNNRPLWYTRFFQPIEGGEQKRHKCIECGFLGMAMPGSLSNLLRHFSAAKYKECGAKYNQWKSEQAKLNSCNQEILNSTSSLPDIINDKLGNLIIAAELPFTLVEIPEFVSFCNVLNSQYKVPSIYKLKNHILIKKRELGDQQLRDELKLSNFVTLTIDGWSSRNLISMMGIIVHYQLELIPKANVLAIEYFKGSHTGERIAEFTLKICKYWGITNKIVRIGTDNAANMIKAFTDFDNDLQCADNDEKELDDELDENWIDIYAIDSSHLLDATNRIEKELSCSFPDTLLVHLRKDALLKLWFPCVCHTAQLAVKDFLDANLDKGGKIRTIVSKSQKFVNSAKKSTKCAEVFTTKKFNLEAMNNTRWNSMYRMLLSIINADEKNLLNELPKLKYDPPSKYEINILREICTVLEPVALFTSDLQATHGTSGMMLPALDIIFKELDGEKLTCMNNSNALSKLLSNFLTKRFEATRADKFYWISTCLDPRFGTEALQCTEYLNTLKKALNILLELERVNFEFYNQHLTEEVEPVSIEESPLKRRKSLFSSKSHQKVPIEFQHSSDVIEMEITLFKAEARIFNGNLEIDPIIWWERNCTKMSLMAKLAKIYLLPPASTAEVERLFSVAGRICRPQRSRLNPKTIELLVTLKFRLLAEKQAKLSLSKINNF